MKKCTVCGTAMHSVFNAQLLRKYEVNYQQCSGCGLLQTEEPYWLDEAYSDAIAVADTGLVMRNFSIASKLVVLLYLAFDKRGTYLDIAGGYGMLTRLMRDYGFDYYWEDKYCQNLLARGFEVDKSTNGFSALTAFEVLEHLPNPVEFIEDAMARHGSRTLIFSTELYTGNEPPPKEWWYYTFKTGQHISFYRRSTLEYVSRRLGLNFYSLRGIHIITDKTINRVPLLNLAMGRFAPFLAFIARRKLGPLTFSDHSKFMR